MGRRKKSEPIRTVRPHSSIPQSQPVVQQGLSNARIKVVPNPPPPLTPAPEARRSLRQQQRQAARTSWLSDYVQNEEEEEDNEEEEEEEGRETYVPCKQQPKRRFLKSPTVSPKGGVRKRVQQPENTATVLNRLIGHHVGVVKPSRGRPPKNAASVNLKVAPARKQVHPHATQKSLIHPAKFMPLAIRPVPPPLLQRRMLPVQHVGHMVPPIGIPQPKKRGRKRKEEALNLSTNVGVAISNSIKFEAAPDQNNVDGHGQANIPRKRGRQSTATETVKPRFPFCSICLSKQPPSEYVIDYLSAPNEYQRMKRLFMFVYKDLKFPFAPFDLEKENVFDYCDLPLCNCCIALYREIFETYSQLESARDELKSKFDRMVYQIQLSEKNPAVGSQVQSIKNSPDQLMNKYNNFRRKFLNYKRGESRPVEAADFVAANTIARIQIISQTPKRSASSQTMLTSANFPPPPAPPTAQAKTNTVNQAGSPTSGASGNAAQSTSTSKTDTPVPHIVIKKEPGANTDTAVITSTPKTTNVTSSASKQVSQSNTSPGTAATSKSLTTPKSSQPAASTPLRTPQQVAPVKQAAPPTAFIVVRKETSSTPMKTAQPVVLCKSGIPTSTASATMQAKPQQVVVIPSKPATPVSSDSSKLRASVVTFVQKPGSMGHSVVRPAPTPTGPLLSRVPMPVILSKNPTTPSGTSATAKQPASQSTPGLTSFVKIKDEPPEQVPPSEEGTADPFLNGDQLAAGRSDTPTNSTDSASSSHNSNIFHKHKKLRIVPVQTYKENSNASTGSDSGSTNAAGKEGGDTTTEKTNDKTKSPEANRTEKKDANSKDVGEDGNDSQEDPKLSKPEPESDSEKSQEPALSRQESSEKN